MEHLLAPRRQHDSSLVLGQGLKELGGEGDGHELAPLRVLRVAEETRVALQRVLESIVVLRVVIMMMVVVIDAAAVGVVCSCRSIAGLQEWIYAGLHIYCGASAVVLYL